jgi:UDP-N-acetylmuramoyl-tripeptide--D-alanyl-D-alanine ligase
VLAKATLIILVSANLLFVWRRLLSFLRYFQQEEYNNTRFIAWIKTNKAFDTRASLILVLALLGHLVVPGSGASLLLGMVAAGALIFVGYVLEGDPRTTGKIKLNMTERATKTAWVAYGMLAVIGLLPLMGLWWSCCTSGGPTITSAAIAGIIMAQLTPAALMLATILLSPAEKRLQQYYYADAQRILKEVDPFIIGITGSYGKTGAKAALGDLLTQTLGSTFWPKKSINTVMGITRTIRETMRPHHKYAVIEMGAYNIGSIKRLCEFTPPKAALVTAVGIMHLERFGTPENVYKAKSEIAQALPLDGILVCNGDSPNARRMAEEHKRATTILYGFDLSKGPLDCFATDITYDDSGTSFVVHFKGQRYPGKTPLLGRPALSNVLGAFAMACALGAEPAFAVACMGNLPPVDNRLVLDKGSKVSYLRDAYNSNPTGFEAALDVLKQLPATRRVLITPGMIELGEMQFEENKRLARMAGSVCDLVYVVGPTNREALLAGLAEANFPRTKTIIADTRDEAFKVLAEQSAQGDLVLIENDLGDLHEGKVRL